MVKGLEPRDRQITIRIPRRLRSVLEAEAKREGRSLADAMVRLLERALGRQPGKRGRPSAKATTRGG